MPNSWCNEAGKRIGMTECRCFFFSSTTRAAVVNEKGFFCLSAVNSGVWHVYGPRSVLQMQCTALLLCARKTQASQAPRWRYYKLRIGNLFKTEWVRKCGFSWNGISWNGLSQNGFSRNAFSRNGFSSKFVKISLRKISLGTISLGKISFGKITFVKDSLERILWNGFSRNKFTQNRKRIFLNMDSLKWILSCVLAPLQKFHSHNINSDYVSFLN